MRNSYKILVGKTGWKRALGRPRSKYKDNIKTDLRDTKCENVGPIQLIKDEKYWYALVNTVIDLRSHKGTEFLGLLSY
jgi:hypothetical protein